MSATEICAGFLGVIAKEPDGLNERAERGLGALSHRAGRAPYQMKRSLQRSGGTRRVG